MLLCKPGETVVDLGAGGGFDCFLAAHEVGTTGGHVIGIDMTPDMLSKARNNVAKGSFKNVHIEPKDESKEFIRDWAPDHNVTDYVVSATIEGIKPEMLK